MSSRSNPDSTGSGPGDSWHNSPELAPSLVRGEDPRLARVIGLMGLSLVLFGALILLSIVFSRSIALRVSPSWGILAVVTGVALLLFHAALDADMQIRQHGLLGYFWLMARSSSFSCQAYVGALFAL